MNVITSVPNDEQGALHVVLAYWDAVCVGASMYVHFDLLHCIPMRKVVGTFSLNGF